MLREFGAPMEITEVQVASPRAGEVLVKVAASGVCGSDIKALDGKSPVVRSLRTCWATRAPAWSPTSAPASPPYGGAQGGDAMPGRDLPLLADLHRRGRLDLEGLVSERLPLEKVDDAVDHVRAGVVARSVIVFD